MSDRVLYIQTPSLAKTPVGQAQVNPDLSGYATKEEVNTALGGKVDKVSGKGLSTNDFTTTEKSKLAGIQAGAQDAYIKGDKVHYPDADSPVYESTVDNNVWNPADYPTGW